MKRTDASDKYRMLPSVDELLRAPAIQAMLRKHPRKLVVECLRAALGRARAAIAEGADAPSTDAVASVAAEELSHQSRLSLRRVVNATGVILHTGLGRAVLAPEAVEAVAQVAASHSSLEIDPATGKRGSRQGHVADLLAGITGAESALVVNNNAAAVLLVVNTLALGGEVIISRGQLVEIGGSFRLPDVITRAGARLVEVGTTNRTRISDYRAALGDSTRLILRCHPSNFRVVGFTEEAPLEELAALGREVGVPVLDDLGSGALVNVADYGLDHEPTVRESVVAGAHLACFSGDKLLGASQAGIIVGSAELVELCRSNPLARALRIDKLCLAAIEATLRLYRDGDPWAAVPVLASISRPLPDIEAQARSLSRRINSLRIPGLTSAVVAITSETGGGSLPGQTLESRAVALKSSRMSAEDMGERFRGWEPPIYGRIARDVFLLDMRTVAPRETTEILGCVKSLAA